MISTIMPTDSDYCFKSSCYYTARIDSEGVEAFEFFTISKPDEIKLEVDHDMTFLDQVTGESDSRTFVFSSPGGKPLNWKFVLTPLQGNPDMGVNVGSKPQLFKDYKWRTGEDRTEGISLHDDDLKTGENIYLTVRSTGKTEFLLTVSNPNDAAVSMLAANTPITGQAHDGEIVNYIFKGTVKIPERIEAFIRLSTIDGNPNLYFKDCSDSDNIRDCKISQDDIDNKDSLSRDKTRLFVYSENNHGDDSKFVKFMCIPTSDEFKNFTFDDANSNEALFVSRDCTFAVGIQGQRSSTSEDSRYTVEIRGAKYHNILNFTKPTYMSLSPNKPTYLKLVVPTVTSTHTNLNFKFVIISGEAEVYISKTFPYPTESNADKVGTVKIASAGNKNSGRNSFISIQDKADKLEGVYYITFYPTKFFYGSVKAYTSENNAEELGSEKFTELSMNEPYLFSQKVKRGDMQSYFFRLDAPEEADTEIFVELMPIVGRFTYCISAETAELESKQGCTWYDDTSEGSIVLSAKDPKFKRKFKYGLIVEPILDRADEPTEVQYSLSISSKDSYFPLLPSMPYSINSLISHKYFKVSIPRSSTSFAVLLTSEDPQAKLLISTESSDLGGKLDSDKYWQQVGINPAKWYDKNEIARICEIKYANEMFTCNFYIKIMPSKPDAYTYSILTYYDAMPITLLDGAVQSLPSPLKKPLQIRFFPTVKSNGTTVSVFCEHYAQTVVVQLLATDFISSRKIEKRFIVNDPQANVVRIPGSYFQNYSDFEVSVQIINDDANKDPEIESLEEHDITKRTTVEISTGPKKLVSGTPFIEVAAEKGLFDYFIFKKKVSAEALVFLKIVAGEADLYIKRGSDKYPDLNTYDFRSNTIKNDEVVLPAGQSTSGAGDYEYFIIGVYPRIATTYILEATYSANFQYMIALPSTFYTKNVAPNKPLFIVYRNKRFQTFNFGAAALNGKLQVHYTSSDEEKDLAFKNNLPTSNDAELKIVTPVFMNKVRIAPSMAFANRTQYIFKLEVDTPTTVYFYASPENSPLELQDGTQVSDSLPSNTCQTYLFRTDRSVTSQELQLTVMSGRIDFYVSDEDITTESIASLEASDTITASTSPVTMAYKVASMMPKADDPDTADLFFRSIYVRVCSKKDPTTFTIGTIKVLDGYRQLFPGERFQINLQGQSSQPKQNYYLKVDNKLVKSLRLKFSMPAEEKNFDSATLLSHLDIYFIADEEFGFEGAENTKKIPISIVSNVNSEEYGNRYIEIGINPIGGYLVIEPKRSSQYSGVFVNAQIQVNDYQTLSPTGKTFAEIENNKEYVFQLVSPPNTMISVEVSSCRGVLEVTVEDFERNRIIMHPMLLGRNLSEFVNNPAADLFRDSNTIFNTTSRVTNIKIKSTMKSTTGFVTINSQIISQEDPMRIEDYFAYYSKATSSNLPIVIEKKQKTFDLIFDPIQPSEGFSERYPDFQSADIDIRVLVGKYNLFNHNSGSRCAIDRVQMPQEVIVRRKALTILKGEEGTLVWPPVPIKVEDIPYPDNIEPPYNVMVQLKITMQGRHPEGYDDDAGVLIKKYLQVDINFTDHPGGILSTFTLVLLIMGALICCYVYKMNQKARETALGRGRGRHQQVASELPQMNLDASGDPSGSNRIESSGDDSTEGGNRPDLNDTI
jgi:hypothetical protein